MKNDIRLPKDVEIFEPRNSNKCGYNDKNKPSTTSDSKRGTGIRNPESSTSVPIGRSSSTDKGKNAPAGKGNMPADKSRDVKGKDMFIDYEPYSIEGEK